MNTQNSLTIVLWTAYNIPTNTCRDGLCSTMQEPAEEGHLVSQKKILSRVIWPLMARIAVWEKNLDSSIFSHFVLEWIIRVCFYLEEFPITTKICRNTQKQPLWVTTDQQLTLISTADFFASKSGNREFFKTKYSSISVSRSVIRVGFFSLFLSLFKIVDKAPLIQNFLLTSMAATVLLLNSNHFCYRSPN